ncbi:MAG: hypothetical protein P8Z76_21150 [Alphaproteobacteria bacterium]
MSIEQGGFDNNAILAVDNWSFERIAAHNADRAAGLESAPPREVLAVRIVQKLHSALSACDARFAIEDAAEDPSNARSVLQFQIVNSYSTSFPIPERGTKMKESQEV